MPQDRDAEFRRVADELVAANYDRTSGAGGAYTFTMKPNIERDMREQTVVQAQETIDRRVNELGVAEPNISRYGNDGDQLLVQLPGVTDVDRAKEIIRSTALLELKLVEAGPSPSREALLQSHGGERAGGHGSRPRRLRRRGDAGTSFYLVRKVAAVTGQDLRNARPSLDENSRPAVGFSLTNEGRAQVRQGDRREHRPLPRDHPRQARAVGAAHRGADQRRGADLRQLHADEVTDLSLILRSGALPASMSYLEERVIGPTLGADSIRAGVTASLAGLALVVLFMLAYYKLSGINAIVAMVCNLVILLGLMAYFGATMTLPGIAGFILTMGMGVDSNVLIFERIKEELAAGRACGRRSTPASPACS